MHLASGRVANIAAAAAGGSSTCCSKLAVLLQQPFRRSALQTHMTAIQRLTCSDQPICQPSGRSRSAAKCHARGKTDLVQSIRAMPIKLVRVSKDNSQAAQDMAQEWLSKLSRQVWHMQDSPAHTSSSVHALVSHLHMPVRSAAICLRFTWRA
jgi:hypothetical protein